MNKKEIVKFLHENYYEEAETWMNDKMEEFGLHGKLDKEVGFKRAVIKNLGMDSDWFEWCAEGIEEGISDEDLMNSLHDQAYYTGLLSSHFERMYENEEKDLFKKLAKYYTFDVLEHFTNENSDLIAL